MIMDSVSYRLANIQAGMRLISILSDHPVTVVSLELMDEERYRSSNEYVHHQ